MAYGPQPYVPPKVTAPRAYIPPPQDINALIAQAQAQRVASMGQLPLTRTLPGLGSGAGDVSALYTRPLNTQPLGLSRALPKIGPGAGDVSELLAPKALGAGPQPAISGVTGPNPAASRAIRGGWEYTPTASTSGYPGQLPLTQQLPRIGSGAGDVSSLYGLPNPPDLPPPPSQSAGQTARGILGSVTSSYVPESLASRLPIGGKFVGGMGGNLLGGLIVSTLAGSGKQALDQSQYANTELGRALSQGLGTTQYGAFLGPQMAAGSMAGGTMAQLGYGSGQGRGVVDTGNTAGNVAAKAWQDTALGSTPGLGMVYRGGQLLGAIGEATGLGDTLGDLTSNTLGKIPVVGGFFNSGGGETQAQEQPQEAPDRSFNSIRQTAAQMGLDPTVANQLESQYNSTIAYMKANPTISIAGQDGTVDAQAKKDFEDAGYKVDAKGNVAVDDAYIQNVAWQNAYDALPAAQASALQSADFARRQAAMQAAIMEVIPQFTQPFYDTANMGYGSLGEMISGLTPNMQGPAQEFVDSGRMWSGRMGDAIAASLANAPAYLAQQQQLQQAQSMAAQIQQAQQQQALAAMYPDLFGSQTSSSGDLSLNDLLAAGG